MRIKIFCAPGDHHDDVTAMTDDRNIGRYLMSVLVAYEPGK